MITAVQISDGRSVNLVDVDNVTPHQGLALATAAADVLIRSGMTRDDVPLTGAHLLQFLSELGDCLAAQREAAPPVDADADSVTIRGEIQYGSSKCQLRFVDVYVPKPYNHEVQLTIEAKADQNDDDLTDAVVLLCDIPVTIVAKFQDGSLICTTDDITPA